VINEDRVAPGEGFGKHPHRDMEIISYVLDGELEHKDSLGTGRDPSGDVQRMSAGTGVFHSEYNPSPKNSVHFLQIWIEPDELGIKPGYEQKFFGPEEKRASCACSPRRMAATVSVKVHQDAQLMRRWWTAMRESRIGLSTIAKPTCTLRAAA